MSQEKVHEAISEWLDEGEIAVAWTLTIDVAGADDTRYLAHRFGGGVDGTDMPMVWAVMGMLRAATQVADDQLADCTRPVDEEGEDE